MVHYKIEFINCVGHTVAVHHVSRETLDDVHKHAQAIIDEYRYIIMRYKLTREEEVL